MTESVSRGFKNDFRKKQTNSNKEIILLISPSYLLTPVYFVLRNCSLGQESLGPDQLLQTTAESTVVTAVGNMAWGTAHQSGERV